MILSAALAVGMVWTDEGFRRAEDCTPTMKYRDWHGGYYWSVRDTYTCTDDVYLSGKWGGKGYDLWTPPEETYSLWTPSSPSKGPSSGGSTRGTGLPAPTGTLPTPPSFWKDSPEPEVPSVTPLPPIPLPASMWLMLTALGIMTMIRKGIKV